jgi:hypothetical protein
MCPRFDHLAVSIFQESLSTDIADLSERLLRLGLRENMFCRIPEGTIAVAYR